MSIVFNWIELSFGKCKKVLVCYAGAHVMHCDFHYMMTDLFDTIKDTMTTMYQLIRTHAIFVCNGWVSAMLLHDKKSVYLLKRLGKAFGAKNQKLSVYICPLVHTSACEFVSVMFIAVHMFINSSIESGLSHASNIFNRAKHRLKVLHKLKNR